MRGAVPSGPRPEGSRRATSVVHGFDIVRFGAIVAEAASPEISEHWGLDERYAHEGTTSGPKRSTKREPFATAVAHEGTTGERPETEYQARAFRHRGRSPVKTAARVQRRYAFPEERCPYARNEAHAG